MRIDYTKANPEAFQAMLAFSKFSESTRLDKKVVELVKIRASQINHCAYCLDMHTTEAIKHGESERRLNVVAAWEESGMFSPSERAALRLTETLTLVSTAGVPDDVYQEVLANFSERDCIDLVMIINIINCWNRVTAALRVEPPK